MIAMIDNADAPANTELDTTQNCSAATSDNTWNSAITTSNEGGNEAACTGAATAGTGTATDATSAKPAPKKKYYKKKKAEVEKVNYNALIYNISDAAPGWREYFLSDGNAYFYHPDVPNTQWEPPEKWRDTPIVSTVIHHFILFFLWLLLPSVLECSGFVGAAWLRESCKCCFTCRQYCIE